jgi:4,5-dihydroxyphthalate decarboxylase
MARDRGEPVRALPIFPLRMPPLSHIYVRTDAPYHVPSDLRGCRVASEAYRLTVNLRLRGMCSEFYGLQPQDVEWFSSLKDEGAGYALPDGVVLHLDAGDPETLLLEGKVDALFLPNAPDAFNAGDPRIRRLFADHQAENETHYRRLGGVPMTHVLVARESVLEREPWIVRSLYDGFIEAQAIIDRNYRRPKYLSIPGALEALERQRRVLGSRPMLTHGLDGNLDPVHAFVRYGYEQATRAGYSARMNSLRRSSLKRSTWLSGLSASAVAAGVASRAESQTLTPITVACGLVEPHAAARYAAARGFFRKHRLDATILTQNNGAANAAAVVSGTAQFGISNILQLAQAHANNVSFKVVALGVLIDAKDVNSGLIVSATGGIANVRDLSGKTIAVSSPRGLDQLETANFIDKLGGDSKSVRFLEMPPTASVAAVAENRVAATVTVPPQLQAALGNGMRSLGDIEASMSPLWVPSGWFTTAERPEQSGHCAPFRCRDLRCGRVGRDRPQRRRRNHVEGIGFAGEDLLASRHQDRSGALSSAPRGRRALRLRRHDEGHRSDVKRRVTFNAETLK